MSDSATLVDRLNCTASLWAKVTVDALRSEAAARIAELEAERNKWHGDAVTQMQHKIRLEDRIAELEAALGDMLRYYEPYAQDFASDEPVSLAWDAAVALLRKRPAP